MKECNASEFYEFKDELPTDGVCRVICSDSVASPTLSSCSLKERNLSPRVKPSNNEHTWDPSFCPV